MINTTYIYINNIRNPTYDQLIDAHHQNWRSMQKVWEYFSKLTNFIHELQAAAEVRRRVYTVIENISIICCIDGYNQIYRRYCELRQFIKALEGNLEAYLRVHRQESNRLNSNDVEHKERIRRTEEAVARAKIDLHHGRHTVEGIRHSLLGLQWVLQNGGKKPFSTGFRQWIKTQPQKLACLNGRLVTIEDNHAPENELSSEGNVLRFDFS